MKVGIVGAGYVGLITGLCLAEKGNRVICLDTDKEKVDKINSKEPPIYEEGLKNLLSKTDLKATSSVDDLSNCELIFIAVPTPSKENGELDLSYVKSAVSSLAHIVSGKSIVVKSTVLPGSTESLIPLLPGLPGKDYGLAMNPEFLREGKAIDDFLNPDRIIFGTYGEKSKKALRELYKEFDAPKIETEIKAAEMIKYVSNAFLATKISFINEIANICTSFGIDVDVVAKAVGMDSRISHHFLNAGPGFGGSCFPKDVSALKVAAKKAGSEPNLLESVLLVNDNQPIILKKWLEKELGSLKEKKIAILGMAFKKGTDDIRESRSVVLADALLKEGAEIFAYDPKAVYEKVRMTSLQDALTDADAVVIMTDWPEIVELDFEEIAKKVKNRLLIDGRRALSPKKAKKAGFKYYGIGFPLP